MRLRNHLPSVVASKHKGNGGGDGGGGSCKLCAASQTKSGPLETRVQLSWLKIIEIMSGRTATLGWLYCVVQLDEHCPSGAFNWIWMEWKRCHQFGPLEDKIDPVGKFFGPIVWRTAPQIGVS